MNTSFSIRGLSLLLFLILAGHLSLPAQDEKPKFGKPAMADLKMTRYDKDTSAEAVILEDIGSTYFDKDSFNGLMLIFNRFERIKILRKDGYSWANHSITLYEDRSSEEKISNLKASTFNLVNNEIVETKLDKASVFEENADYNHKIKKFTLPAVKEGSVIDIQYTIQSPFFINVQPWSFQNVIPERHSEYEVSFLSYFNYKKQITGYYPVTVTHTNSDENTYKFSALDVPAMKMEPYARFHDQLSFEGRI